MFCVFGLCEGFRRQGNLGYEVRVFLKGAPPPLPRTNPVTCARRGTTVAHYVFSLFFWGCASQPASQGGGEGGFPKPASHRAAARRTSTERMRQHWFAIYSDVPVTDILCSTDYAILTLLSLCLFCFA